MLEQLAAAFAAAAFFGLIVVAVIEHLFKVLLDGIDFRFGPNDLPRQ